MTLTGDIATTPSTAPRPRVRYVGVDLARFIAIAGMMAAHLIAMKYMLPHTEDSERPYLEVVSLVTNGTAAALFAVLGGVSIVFATQKLLRNGQRWKATAAVAVRGAVLIVLGVALGSIDNSIIVILAYYGVAMILVSPLVAVRSWVLGAIAGVLALAFGWLNIHLRAAIQTPLEGPHTSISFLAQDPGVALRALLVTGEYPAITWVTYLLVGMLIGRALTNAARQGTLGQVAAKLAALGAAMFIVAQLITNWVLANLIEVGILSPGTTLEEGVFHIMHLGGSGAPPSRNIFSQILASPHSGSVMDLVRTFGISFAVIGVLVFLCDRERRALTSTEPGLMPAGTAVATPSIGARLLDVVRATGAAPLTIYTLHIVVSGLLWYPYFSSTADPAGLASIPWWVVGNGAFALQIAGALAIGAVLSVTKKRGPLEALLSKIVNFVVR